MSIAATARYILIYICGVSRSFRMAQGPIYRLPKAQVAKARVMTEN